jgi:hypothetical protein
MPAANGSCWAKMGKGTMKVSIINSLVAPRKACNDNACGETCYSLGKVLIWSAFFSLAIVGPHMFACYKQSLEINNGLTGLLDTGIALWVAVWIASIAMAAHEKVNHFLTLMINSMSVPGFVVGVTTLASSGV